MRQQRLRCLPPSAACLGWPALPRLPRKLEPGQPTDCDPLFARDGVQQINLLVFFENRRVTELVDRVHDGTTVYFSKLAVVKL